MKKILIFLFIKKSMSVLLSKGSLVIKKNCLKKLYKVIELWYDY